MDTIKISMDIEKETWKRFKIRCIEQEKTATEVVNGMILEYIKKK